MESPYTIHVRGYGYRKRTRRGRDAEFGAAGLQLALINKIDKEIANNTDSTPTPAFPKMMKLLTAAALPFLVAADLLPQRPMRGGTPSPRRRRHFARGPLCFIRDSLNLHEEGF